MLNPVDTKACHDLAGICTMKEKPPVPTFQIYERDFYAGEVGCNELERGL